MAQPAARLERSSVRAGAHRRTDRGAGGVSADEARLPIRQIQEYLRTLHHLELSIGEIVELTHTVRRELQPEMDKLLAEVQTSPVAHGDETGWRENGQNGYVWGFLGLGAQPTYYFVYHQSRASRFPKGFWGCTSRAI